MAAAAIIGLDRQFAGLVAVSDPIKNSTPEAARARQRSRLLDRFMSVFAAEQPARLVKHAVDPHL